MWALVAVLILVIVVDLITGGSWVTGATGGVLLFTLLMWLEDWWQSR
jgi:hypothetical protein